MIFVPRFGGNGFNHNKIIKIFGLQRSGTNYASILLQENYDCFVLVTTGGSKHDHYAIPANIGIELKTVICCKNPYAWLCSIYKYCKEVDLQLDPGIFEEFIHNRFLLYRTLVGMGDSKESYRIVVNRAKNPIQYWNNFNFHWIESCQTMETISAIIDYERLLKQPGILLDKLAESFKLNRKTPKNEFWIPENKLKGWGDFPSKNESCEDYKFTRQDFFLNREYLKEYTSEMLEFVNSELDNELMEMLGYKYEIK